MAWSGMSSQPPAPTSPGATGSLPLSYRASARAAETGGRESAAHFGLEGESEKEIRERKWWERVRRSSSDSLQLPAAFLGSLVPGPLDRGRRATLQYPANRLPCPRGPAWS